MTRSTLARRYAPLVALGAIQLLIIAVVPSKGAQSTVAAATGTGAYGSLATPGAPGAATPTGGTTAAAAGPDATIASGGGPVASGGTTATSSSPAGATAASQSGPSAPAGDTSHCVNGRQFDPAIDFYAPPCLPKFSGDNHGATYPGVTGDTVKIVDYYDRGNDAVNQILMAEGQYISIDQLRAFDKAAETFINSHYELYGRKVKIDVYQGTCQSIPPDVPCLRKEMDDLVASEQPFAVKWDTSLCSACYDELSQKHVINVGGYSFRDDFAVARRPYHWDVQESGTSLAKGFAQFYCSALQGKPAQFAGTQNPTDQINGRQRVLGVIATNDPENQGAINQMKAELAKCGASVAHEYYYAQDITTAEQQRAAGVQAMRQSPEATTVLCFCDAVAPQFLYEEEQQENYYPENAIAGAEFMDVDSVGQSYGPGASGGSSLACPLPQNGCEYDVAFGVSSQSVPMEPVSNNAGTRVWKLGGGQGAPPYEPVWRTWDYYSLLASLIQGAGPDLTPVNVEAGALQAPAIGGGDTGRTLRGFTKGNYGWNQDLAVVYWSRNQTSKYNGKKGAYVQIGGRHKLGEWSTTDLPIPPTAQR